MVPWGVGSIALRSDGTGYEKNKTAHTRETLWVIRPESKRDSTEGSDGIS